MFSLHFHYEDVSRQNPLLKPNHVNIMEVLGSCEIRLVPNSDFRILFGKLAMEMMCGQRFFQTKRGPSFQGRKSFRSNPFLGSEKDIGYVSDFAQKKRSPRASNVSFFYQNLESNVSFFFSGRNKGKLHSFFKGNRVLQILPGTGRSFRDLRVSLRVQCDYCHFGQQKR